MSTRAGGPLAAVTAIAGLALTAGCGLMGGDEATQSHEERLVEMVNESYRLESELSSAELRIVKNCLEDQGFTVHDAYTFQKYEPEEQDSLTWGYPHEGFLVDPEEAAEVGFGAWAESVEAQEDGSADDYYALQEEEWAEEEENWEEPDNSEFEALPPQEQYDWWVAYQGEEKAAEYYAHLLDPNYGEDEGMAVDADEAAADEAAAEEEAAAANEGELEIEDEETWVEPKPGGCELEMIQSLYGEPEFVEHTEEYDGETETWTEWSYRPENPEHGEDASVWEDVEAAYAQEMGDLQYEFTDCLTAAGYEGWEFGEGGYLPTWEFFYSIYAQDTEDAEMMMGDSGVELPPVPDGLTTYEDRKAYELAAAVAFADCGEQLDYAKTSEKVYDEANIEAYSGLEEDVHAWQEEMNSAITKAQELLDA